MGFIQKALVGFRGRGVGDVIQADFCHLFVLKALIFQGASKCLESLGQYRSIRPRNPIRAIQNSGQTPSVPYKWPILLPTLFRYFQHATYHTCSASGRCFASASRTSRDTPQSSIAWTLHTSLLISRGLKFSNVEGLRFQSHGSSCLTGDTKNRKNPCIPLKLSR
jgi:hypothetical protein